MPTNPLTHVFYASDATMFAVRPGDIVSPNGVDRFVVVKVDGYTIKLRRTFWSWVSVTLRILAWRVRGWIAKVWP